MSRNKFTLQVWVQRIAQEAWVTNVPNYSLKGNNPKTIDSCDSLLDVHFFLSKPFITVLKSLSVNRISWLGNFECGYR